MAPWPGRSRPPTLSRRQLAPLEAHRSVEITEPRGAHRLVCVVTVASHGLILAPLCHPDCLLFAVMLSQEGTLHCVARAVCGQQQQAKFTLFLSIDGDVALQSVTGARSTTYGTSATRARASTPSQAWALPAADPPASLTAASSRGSWTEQTRLALAAERSPLNHHPPTATPVASSQPSSPLLAPRPERCTKTV